VLSNSDKPSNSLVVSTFLKRDVQVHICKQYSIDADTGDDNKRFKKVALCREKDILRALLLRFVTSTKVQLLRCIS
jgi:hypothetical protein